MNLLLCRPLGTLSPAGGEGRVRGWFSTSWRDLIPRTLACRNRWQPLHARPEFVTSLTQHEPDAIVGKHDIVKIGLDRVWHGNLRHGPVITAMPARILILVTVTAGL